MKHMYVRIYDTQQHIGTILPKVFGNEQTNSYMKFLYRHIYKQLLLSINYHL